MRLSSVKVLLFAGIYFALALLGLKLATLNQNASPVWPATGFAIALVHLCGRRAAIAVLLGAFAANLNTNAPILATLLISAGNTLEALLGAYVMGKVLNNRKNEMPYIEAAATLLGVVSGSLASATVGVFALTVTGAVPIEQADHVWLTWWVGDTLGGFVLTPLLISFRYFSCRNIPVLNAIGVLSLGVLLTYTVFFVHEGGPFVFVLFPILLYAVLALGDSCVLMFSAMICGAGIWATILEKGPFSSGVLNERLIHLQLFLAAIALTGVMLSGVGRALLSRTAILVLLGSWFLAGFVFFSFETSERSKTETRFADLIADATAATARTLEDYEEELRAGAGLFAASEEVRFDEWREFIHVLGVLDYHNGMTGIGFISVVSPKNLKSFEKKIAAQGIDQYRAKPVPGHESEFEDTSRDHFIIQWLEPLERNRAAFGLDVGSEPNRRAAAERARDAGASAITEKIVLVQDQAQTPGFLLYYPVYSGKEKPASLAERRLRHRGWVYAPIIYKNFFTEIFSALGNEVEVEVFDGESPAPDRLVYSNLSEGLNSRLEPQTTHLKLGQNDYLLRWQKSKNFISTHDTVVAWVGLCGALATLLLASLVISLELVGRNARAMAEELTRELTASREIAQKGERRLKYALEGSNDAIWDWDLVSSEMFVSGKLAEMNGWPSTFRVKKERDLGEYAHPDDLSKITRSVREVLSGNARIHEVETRYRTVQGSWHWVLTRGNVSERDSQGFPTRMTGVHIDIQEMKSIQQELESARVQMRHIADAVPTLISLWDGELRCVFANEAFCQWFGESAEKIVGMHLPVLMGAANFDERRSLIERARKGERIQYERSAIRRSDGEARHLVATFAPRTTVADVGGVYFFIQDVTELKRAELRALEGQQVAMEAANIKSQFLANMSHEIRTPLNGIIGMNDILLRSGLPPEQHRYLELIARSSRSLLSIVNDILDLSKIEAGKLELETVPFDLNELLLGIRSTLSLVAEGKGLSMNCDLELGAKTRFIGDPGRLGQILNNLIGNAIKFTSNGSVSVLVRAKDQGERTSLFFEVSDTGIGIPPKDFDRLFKKFSQADTSTTRKYGGTGLGLSICKEIVEAMGGKIGMRSQVNSGSTFWFEVALPRVKVELVSEPSSALKSAQVSGTQKSRGRVLLVEDNEVNRVVIGLHLESLSYEYEVAADGKAALLLLENHTFDLVLMDCQMPGMDGFSATRALRASAFDQQSRVPVIAITASAMKGDRERCLDAGMDDYLSKPVSVDTVEAMLAKWCRPSKKRSSPIDEEAIGKLRKLQKPGRPDLVAKLFDIFEISMKQGISELREAVKVSDFATVASSAHRLKSSAATIGAFGFVSLCRELETAGEESMSLIRLSELVELLESEGLLVLAEIEGYKKKITQLG